MEEISFTKIPCFPLKEERKIFDQWEKITDLSRDRLQILNFHEGKINLKVNLSGLEIKKPERADNLVGEKLKLIGDFVIICWIQKN